MKITAEQLRRKLESELDPGAVENDASVVERYAVDGKQPTLICSPATPEQVALALRLSSAAEAAVIPWGGGTAMALGNPPRQADLVLKTERLDRVIEHDHDNLTATVQTGLTVAALQEVLAGKRQFLPIDVPHRSPATVGGAIAANLNGARRSAYGSVRDLVIGMKVVLASGEHIKAGGKVVKNVAGYDMCKLFVSSLGTLGVITEATLRMAPVPETTATLIASGPLSQTWRFVDDLARSPLLPTALVLMDARAGAVQDGMWAAAARFDGFAETVSRQVAEARVSAGAYQLSSDIRRDNPQSQLWDSISQFPFGTEQIIYRVNILRSAAAGFLSALQAWMTADFQPAMLIDTLSGTWWIAAQANQAAANQFANLIKMANEHHGHAIMFCAPPAFKSGVDVWGSPPRSISLMRGIKRQFDPLGLLSPGRFVAGL